MNQKELLQHITAYWKTHNIFQKSLDQRSDLFYSSTYDGPPFASGTPHFGHGLTSSMKDCILRYKTMKGYKVNRDRGWDCHGLPVEKAVEKELGIDGKRDIEEKIGIEKFVEACRKYVGTTSDEWRIFVDSIGRWADMDHAYYTMDVEFMESVLYVFKTMYNQNLVYKGFKVQWYCPSCATSLSNAEVNEGYQDRQDPAITIKFQLTGNQSLEPAKYETSTDGFIHVVAGVLKRDGKYFMIHHQKENLWFFPGGKVHIGETFEQALTREFAEETGIEIKTSEKLGSVKIIHQGKAWVVHYYSIASDNEPTLQESDKHTACRWISRVDCDNSFGFAIKIDETIIETESELQRDFIDFYLFEKNIITQEHIGDAPMYFLAWTTTPWTLPSNMFLAVGEDIDYSIVFDLNTKEYYILAHDLVKSYYKHDDEYLLVYTLKGKELLNLSYTPLFPYITESKLSTLYKQQFFRIIAGEFVSTGDGTGIVHIAPSFGIEDFEAVAAFLPREDARNRLFLPVDDYGEFTSDVPDYQGIRVYDANKEIIARLKTEAKLIGQKSYNHSYPHCRRCDTPLISKALTSWFIKEQELSSITLPHTEDIGFVPESIKNRFRDVLKSAPDWNLARNRYRGSPIPVWENQSNDQERIIVGTLDELYHLSTTGSKNITKNIFIRHGETDYNIKKLCDSFGKPVLTDIGQEQATNLANTLTLHIGEQTIFVVSPLQRSWQTIKPTLIARFGADEVASLESSYYQQIQHYQELWTKGTLFNYIHDREHSCVFALSKAVFVDYRITDHLSFDIQDKHCACDTLNWTEFDQPISAQGETLALMMQRAHDAVTYWNTQFPTNTIIYTSHNDTMAVCRNTIRKRNYHTQRKTLLLKNGEFAIHYRNNDIGKEVDLHKPYIDSYWFVVDGNIYKRIPEVMDCWFESGSMPFGQANYLGETGTHKTAASKKFAYPADFIIEGLDQTRGWFRTLHVVGNAVKGQNSFNNVVINGMVLAEDGRKMSKKLKNYPDPQAIFERYGSDAYRLYLLASPAVKAEPVRFSEKGVDQVFKDFTSALLNAYKFFETYAKVDNFVYNKPTIHFVRHAKAHPGDDGELTPEGINAMRSSNFIEKILRTNPDVIYTSPLTRAQQTAQEIQHILLTYRNKNIKIVVDTSLTEQQGTLDLYTKIVEKHPGKSVLLVAHEPNADMLWQSLYTTQEKVSLKHLEILALPNYTISNELDKWILAALHECALEMEQAMDTYQLDSGTKALLGFIDKLNNWYIRRSRRRFWASGMDDDKLTAYSTLYEVLCGYLKLCAPFAPFVSEYLYLELRKFSCTAQDTTCTSCESIHLEHLPVPSSHYINKPLLEEIALVRRIISLGLFIRSKNKVAIKQPLQKMELKIN